MSIIALRDGIAVAEERPEADQRRDNTAAFQIKRLDVDLRKARELDDDIARLSVQHHM